MRALRAVPTAVLLVASLAVLAAGAAAEVISIPGTKVAITVGEPFVVEREMDADTLEERRRDLENSLNRLMEISEARVGVQTEATSAAAGRTEEDV